MQCMNLLHGHPCIVQLGVGWIPATFRVKFFAMMMVRGVVIIMPDNDDTCA